MRHHRTIHLVAAALLLSACAADSDRDADSQGGPVPMLVDSITPAAMKARVEQFAPATIEVDAPALQAWEKQVLALLTRASSVLHDVFELQVSPQNPQWRGQLAYEQGDGKDAALEYFEIMVGPWDRLRDDEPFLEVGPKPPGAGFYPGDLTRQELEEWLNQHPEDRENFTSPFTVVRREMGKLVSIPYSQEYREALTRAADLMHQAAGIARGHNASLADFLDTRADAFLSDDYYKSDVAWMDIAASRIEPTIGPYEVYEDKLMGYKAAFESFITVADSAASAELDELKSHLRELEGSLPIEDRYKNLDRGFESPIRVVDVAYTAGDARRGVQTIAFNLPNDERVRKEKGSKKVMLRNVSRAKFDKMLLPIARDVLDPGLVERIDFKPWFTNVLMHELAHGLGPGFIEVGGQRMTVNQALKEQYSSIEEAKADVTGLHNMSVLAGRGFYDEDFVQRAYIGHLADMFRAVRFGTSEAHGQANLLQFNYLWDKGAIRYDSTTQRFSADPATLARANRELAHDLLTLEALGSYQGAVDLLKKYGTTMRPEMSAALARLKDVPVDIRPVYPAADSVDTWAGAR